MNKTALITGVTGQDGAYLSEYLLKKGYTVHGIKRRASMFNTERIDHIYQDPHLEHRNFILHYGDMTDSMNITRIVQEVQPDEIYNLAAMSHVKVSFDTPEYTANADGIGTLRLLEAVRLLGLTKKSRIYQARPQSCSDLYRRCRRRRRHRFIPVLRMALPSFMHTGSPSTTARPTTCTPAMGSSSTMSRPSGVKPS